MRETNNRDTGTSNQGEMNQRIGRDLYEKDKAQEGNQRYGYRGQHTKKWDEGNYFHTGPSPRGAQDRNAPQNYNRGSSYEISDQSRHYGIRQDSPYRNESSYLNHGDRNSSNYPNQGYIGNTNPGNYNEPPRYNQNIHREGPGTRSRYKEDDYRYGSGSHNWYREGRYTPNESYHNPNDNRGIFQRMGDNIRNTWNDIMHSDDPEYQRNHSHSRPYEQDRGPDSRQRYGSEPYRDRRFDRGYEGGPRWADETDSGRDNYYDR